MTTATMNRINAITEKRSKLFRAASNGHRGDAAVRESIRGLTDELEGLWNQRRRELAGHREGIDLLVEHAYEQVYGAGFESAVSPVAVGTAEEMSETLAA